jgi:SPP1 gp7 family putative phage head morphogenesis protein
MRTDIDGLFADLAKDQADFEAQSLSVGGSVDRITSAQAFAAYRSRPMEGRLLKDWLRDLPGSHRNRIQQQIRIAFTEGESLSNVKRRIRDATNMNERGLTALIRTSNTHIASSVSHAVYEQNDDLMSRYEWRSILDSRTTPICQARDGEIYELGKGNPRPPAHINCRSTTTPILDDFPPPERVTYEQWLRKQPKKIQNEILGKKRAEAWRSGKYTVKNFVDRKGKRIPNSELSGVTRSTKPQASKAKPKAPSKAAQSLAEANEAARDYVLDNGRRDGIEYMSAISAKTFQVLGTNKGKRSSVVLPDEALARLSDKDAEMILHHNHPSSNSLSPADVFVAAWRGVKELWAHGHNGSSYVVRNPKSWKVKATHTRAQNQVSRVMQDLVNRDVISVSDANRVYWHTVNRLLSRRGHFEYGATLKAESLEAWERVGKIIEDAL